MGSRRFALAFVVIAAIASMGAQYRTTNFLVSAQDPDVAKRIGDQAEIYRREKAIMWLGQEMPNWPQPCPLHVTVNMEGPSGATSFQFGQGRVLSMKMEIQGPLDRLLASVLPHEITHTVFAHHFRQPVPRWADEGGSVLSEDDMERDRHDRLTRQILNRNQQIPLKRLFSLKDYPREVMCLYAQGYSMSDYLVKRSSHAIFLNFIGYSMQHGWDAGVQSFYNHRSVDELEAAWLKHLLDTKSNPKTPPAQVAPQVASAQGAGGQGSGGQGFGPRAQPANRPLVRLTAPPVQPLEPTPVFRGTAPAPDQIGQRFAPAQTPPLAAPQPQGGWTAMPGHGRPQYLPESLPANPTASSPPAPSPPAPSPPRVTLGPIQPDYPNAPAPPRNVSPVGFPRQ